MTKTPITKVEMCDPECLDSCKNVHNQHTPWCSTYVNTIRFIVDLSFKNLFVQLAITATPSLT